jgi:hypothetical protein
MKRETKFDLSAMIRDSLELAGGRPKDNGVNCSSTAPWAVVKPIVTENGSP